MSLKRVRVIESDQIVKPLRNQVGTLTEAVEIHPPQGKLYFMWRVTLDNEVDVGGGINLKNLYMPSSCFGVEEIKGGNDE